MITNQRAIALGLMTPPELDAQHARALAEPGSPRRHLGLPSQRERCCRKPLPAHPLSDSMFRDAASDIAAGQAVGPRPCEAGDADLIVPDLAAAVDLLLSR